MTKWKGFPAELELCLLQTMSVLHKRKGHNTYEQSESLAASWMEEACMTSGLNLRKQGSSSKS